MKACSFCGRQVQDEARKCRHCKALLKCPYCAEELRERSTLCAYCGEALPAALGSEPVAPASRPAESPAPEAPRRQSAEPSASATMSPAASLGVLVAALAAVFCITILMARSRPGNSPVPNALNYADDILRKAFEECSSFAARDFRHVKTVGDSDFYEPILNGDELGAEVKLRHTGGGRSQTVLVQGIAFPKKGHGSAWVDRLNRTVECQ